MGLRIPFFALTITLLAACSDPAPNIEVDCSRGLADGIKVVCLIEGDGNDVANDGTPREDVTDGGAGEAGSDGETAEAPIASCFWKFNPADLWYAECRPALPTSGSLSTVSVLIDPPDNDALPAPRPKLALIRCPVFKDPAGCEMVDSDEDVVATVDAWRTKHWIDLSLSLAIDPAAFDYLLVFEPGAGSNCGPILDTQFSID